MPLIFNMHAIAKLTFPTVLGMWVLLGDSGGHIWWNWLFMCAAHSFLWIPCIQNALLVNYSIFSPCSNLLQIASEDEHAQSPWMAYSWLNVHAFHLEWPEHFWHWNIAFHLPKKTIKTVLACFVRGRKIMMSTICTVCVCKRNIECLFEGNWSSLC